MKEQEVSEVCRQARDARTRWHKAWSRAPVAASIVYSDSDDAAGIDVDELDRLDAELLGALMRVQFACADRGVDASSLAPLVDVLQRRPSSPLMAAHLRPAGLLSMGADALRVIASLEASGPFDKLAKLRHLVVAWGDRDYTDADIAHAAGWRSPQAMMRHPPARTLMQGRRQQRAKVRRDARFVDAAARNEPDSV